MNLVEVDRALRTLRLSGMADVLEASLRHAQTERLPPLDLIASLVSDELQLAHQDPHRFASGDRFAVKLTSLDHRHEMAAFAVSTNGRICPVHRG